MVKPIRCSACGTVLQRRALFAAVEQGKGFTCPNSNCLRKLTADEIENFLIDMGEISYREPAIEDDV